jgi:hypothetical protein
MASRTYYASQALGLYPKGFLPTSADWSSGTSYNAGYGAAPLSELQGVQSVGFSSSVEFEQVFELGHLQIFENIEGSPTCEMTIERVLGLGNWTLFQLFTGSSASTASGDETRNYGVNMSNFASDRGCSARLSVHGDGSVMTNQLTAGAAANAIYGFQIDGFTSNYSLSAQTDGAVTESLGIAGVNLTHIPSGSANVDRQVRPAISQPYGTFRRQDCTFSFQELLDGDLNAVKGRKSYKRVQSASINIDVGREDLLEMGRKGPYIRYASFPVEVTCDVEYNVDRGINTGTLGGRFQDGVNNASQQMSAIDSDSNCELNPSEGYVVSIHGGRRYAPAGCDDVNDANPGDGVPAEHGGTMYNFMAAISGAKLQSQSYSGGDTGGGVVTISESYTAFNAARVIGGYTGYIDANGSPSYS